MHAIKHNAMNTFTKERKPSPGLKDIEQVVGFSFAIFMISATDITTWRYSVNYRTALCVKHVI